MKPSTLPVMSMVPSGLKAAHSGCVLLPKVTLAPSWGRECHWSRLCQLSVFRGAGSGDESALLCLQLHWKPDTGEACASSGSGCIQAGSLTKTLLARLTTTDTSRATAHPAPVWGRSPPRRARWWLCRGTGQTLCQGAAGPGPAACGREGGKQGVEGREHVPVSRRQRGQNGRRQVQCAGRKREPGGKHCAVVPAHFQRLAQARPPPPGLPHSAGQPIRTAVLTHHLSAWPTSAMRREGGTMTTSWLSACASAPRRLSLDMLPYRSRTSR